MDLLCIFEESQDWSEEEDLHSGRAEIDEMRTNRRKDKKDQYSRENLGRESCQGSSSSADIE